MTSMYGSQGNKIPKGYELSSFQKFDPQQMQLYQSLYPHLEQGGFLSQLAQGNQETFDQIEAPALKQFNALQGGIASRFSGMGSGARHSSGFGQAQNAAASDFAQQLQSNRQALQRQAVMDLFGLSEQLLGQSPYEQGLTKKQPSFWEQIFSGLGGAAIGGASGYAQGGWPGAAIGAAGGFGAGVKGGGGY